MVEDRPRWGDGGGLPVCLTAGEGGAQAHRCPGLTEGGAATPGGSGRMAPPPPLPGASQELSTHQDLR